MAILCPQKDQIDLTLTSLTNLLQAASLRVCHESNKTQCAFEVLILDPLLVSVAFGRTPFFSVSD